jgi:hypothetical protein
MNLVGRNVVQTIAIMTPDEYERLRALNAWTGMLESHEAGPYR